MKHAYQKPEIEITAIGPIEVIAATVRNIEGKSGNETIIEYGGGGSGPARAGESKLWDEEEDTGWDNL